MMTIGTSFDDFLEEEGLLVGSDEVAIARCRAYMPIDIGFTGTRKGMSDEQELTLMRLLAKFRKPCRLHHGMCVGADAEAHAICRDMDIQLEGHPPSNTIMMAKNLEGFAAMRKPLPCLTCVHANLVSLGLGLYGVEASQFQERRDTSSLKAFSSSRASSLPGLMK
jgi:hypothetical protein